MSSATQSVPDRIGSVEELEELLCAPTGPAIEGMRRIEGDLILLGVGGKMGPTLARMAKRASEAAGIKRRVIGVSRFSNPSEEASLQRHGVETIRADLMDREQLRKLPDGPNVIYMPGMKFGATGNEALTWGMNVYLPGMVLERYAGSRVVAFSTGNVYGLVPVTGGGSVETDALNPQGEYAMTAVGRERMVEHFSRTLKTPAALIRLNYAVEMRYGVLVDLARKVWAGEAIDVSMGNFNVIWQGDANAMALAAFARVATPPFVMNVAGPEQLSVRRVCEQLGSLMKKPVELVGRESSDALLNNGQLGHRLFGYPRISAQQMIVWVAEWIARGGVTHNRPTHFEVRDGKF